MIEDLPIQLVILFILLGASAFFSASETAFFSLGFIRLRRLQSFGGRGERQVAELLLRPKRLIITILIGNELVNVASSSVVGAYIIDLVGPGGRWYAVGLMTTLILIFGEIIPKSLAVTYPVKYSLFAAPILRRFRALTAVPSWLIYRFTKLFIGPSGKEDGELITEDDFRSLVREGRRTGALDKDEEDIIYNILELEESPVSCLMIPRTEIFALPEDITLREALTLIKEKTYSRVPIYHGDIDQIIGILYLKDLLMARAGGHIPLKEKIGRWAKKPFIVPEGMRADDLFMEFRNRHIQIAVVVDEYGGTAGIVTLDDLLRKLFEDTLKDLSLAKGFYRELSPGVFFVSGKMPVEEFNRRFETEFFFPDINTIGGFVLHLFGRLPHRGEVLQASGLRFRVLAVDEQRISALRVEPGKEIDK